MYDRGRKIAVQLGLETTDETNQLVDARKYNLGAIGCEQRHPSGGFRDHEKYVEASF